MLRIHNADTERGGTSSWMRGHDRHALVRSRVWPGDRRGAVVLRRGRWRRV